MLLQPHRLSHLFNRCQLDTTRKLSRCCLATAKRELFAKFPTRQPNTFFLQPSLFHTCHSVDAMFLRQPVHQDATTSFCMRQQNVFRNRMCLIREAFPLSLHLPQPCLQERTFSLSWVSTTPMECASTLVFLFLQAIVSACTTFSLLMSLLNLYPIIFLLKASVTKDK